MNAYPPYFKRHFQFPGTMTPAVKYLLLINIGAYIVALMAGRSLFINIFGLTAPDVFDKLKLYQFITYLFVHVGYLSPSPWHLLINMFILWMFGRELESFWGTKYFIKYYLITGVGAGLCSLPFIWGKGIPVVGASGAIFGLLLAYGMIFPERIVTLLLFFVLPIQMKAKYLVVVFMALELLLLLSVQGRGGGGIAHFAHLGGMLVGWFYIKGPILSKKFFRPSIPRPPPEDRDNFRLELDRILDKLAQKGWDGLNQKEKQFLHDASKRN